jgi:NodT family efflux transporter outer membrane factor (OMF) lipoprotein
MVAEVARSYLELRALQRRLDVARENIRVQRDTWELTRVRFEAGVISNLDVVRAEAQLRTTESQVPVLETGLRQAVHRLSVLLGSEPGALAAELAPVGPLPVEPPVVPVGLPSTLLARRPDVRRAERELAVATAAIGVATADLYPRFSLTGGGGVESTRLEDLARGGSVYWFVGPSFSWPIFHAGAIRANIRVQDARAEQALARYEQTVLVSLREVEDALVAYAQERERRARLTEAVTADRSAVELARELNDRGLVDFLNVLDAQRSLYLVEDQLVQSDQAVVTNLVLLYKALGGGWEG